LEFDIGDLLPDNVLMYADRFSMRWGIEVRPPLLSRDILALARSVPTEFLISNGQTKRILREAARGILPTDLIERKKEGFLLPLDKWLRNELRNWMMTEFSESKIKSINILNYDRCSKLIDKLDFYDFRVTSLVWKLMCFQEWYSQTYD
jgi:asparagine synthase (glutamine-hydrolysing)